MQRRLPVLVLPKRQQYDYSPPPSLSPPTTSSTVTSSVTPTSATTQSAPPIVAAVTSPTSHAGTIAGCVVGGVVFLVLLVLGALLYLRARKRKRTPPSSEFINSLKAGNAPVLRLDSGAEYTPALAEKGGVYTHYAPPPLIQNSSYTSSPMSNMKFPDEMMTTTDIPSGRPSVETPLRPQRLSSQTHASEPFAARHQPSASVGSRRELWGETISVSAELSPMRQSPICVDSALEFAPRFSSDEPCMQSSYPSQSPTSLQPLRRQPD